jgi:hypothetical protein
MGQDAESDEVGPGTLKKALGEGTGAMRVRPAPGRATIYATRRFSDTTGPRKADGCIEYSLGTAVLKTFLDTPACNWRRSGS